MRQFCALLIFICFCRQQFAYPVPGDGEHRFDDNDTYNAQQHIHAGECEDIDCAIGFRCEEKNGHTNCKIASATIICIIVGGLVIIFILPVAASLLIYCCGIACNIQSIQDFFKDLHCRCKRQGSESQQPAPKNLASRRKRQVKKYLEHVDNEQKLGPKKSTSKSEIYPVRGAVFVRTAPSTGKEKGLTVETTTSRGQSPFPATDATSQEEIPETHPLMLDITPRSPNAEDRLVRAEQATLKRLSTNRFKDIQKEAKTDMPPSNNHSFQE